MKKTVLAALLVTAAVLTTACGSGSAASGNVSSNEAVTTIQAQHPEEAAQAGRAAAKYALQGGTESSGRIPIRPTGGVRYTVPVALRKDQEAGEITIRMRVDNVYQNKYLCLYADEERLVRRKRMIMAPGEMETIRIDYAKLAKAETITVRLED